MSDTQRISIESLRVDGGTQPRGELNADYVAELVERIGNGDKLPPLSAVYDGTDYWLWDGFHRCCAYADAGVEAVDVEVATGTQADAQWRSYAANRVHGLRRTSADKRRAVEAALGHPNGARLSDRSIADHCGVSHTLVAQIRDSVGNGCQQNTRTGTDGKQYKSTKPATQPKREPKGEPVELVDTATGEVVQATRTPDVPAKPGKLIVRASKGAIGLSVAADAINTLGNISEDDPEYVAGLMAVLRWTTERLQAAKARSA
jgi:hypothetical protein